jgi:hypothetical protein
MRLYVTAPDGHAEVESRADRRIYVKHLLFWHGLCILDCGRSTVGAVADTKRRARAQYHYENRKVRKNAKDLNPA